MKCSALGHEYDAEEKLDLAIQLLREWERARWKDFIKSPMSDLGKRTIEFLENNK